MKPKFTVAAALAAVLLFSACASSQGSIATGNSSVASNTPASAATTSSRIFNFAADGGRGSLTIYGRSAVAVWFADMPGGFLLDLAGAANISDGQSVVVAALGLWFASEESEAVQFPDVYASAGGGKFSDSLGTQYVVDIATAET